MFNEKDLMLGAVYICDVVWSFPSHKYNLWLAQWITKVFFLTNQQAIEDTTV